MSSKKAQAVKINNRKAAHSQHPESLKTKRQGSGKGNWGDPMDDLKYLNQDSQPSTNPNDPNYEEPQPINEDEYDQQQSQQQQQPEELEQQESTEIAESDYFQNFQSDVESLSAFKIKVEELVNEYLYD
eukprot:CAMPEP_0201581412 /NCGR_PEP_ID=MMETSP0190_2-20130828/67753_1 /ASSEMBLY_ACC=CAM_ASM_000263 /TAXON_ID=37353 /ORGANISM="Rosalina sp." /LENGTH=128 /DNA_ID=CAMNT_0048019281 /DNA_START=25 /DNA_END=408 /DNA_ORIENTATION=+